MIALASELNPVFCGLAKLDAARVYIIFATSLDFVASFDVVRSVCFDALTTDAAVTCHIF